MLREIEEVIEVSEELLKKINWAKNFSGEKIQIENGKLIKLLPTNIAYEHPTFETTIENFINDYDNEKGLTFEFKNENEIIHKVIPVLIDDKFNKNKLHIGVITTNIEEIS